MNSKGPTEKKKEIQRRAAALFADIYLAILDEEEASTSTSGVPGQPASHQTAPKGETASL